MAHMQRHIYETSAAAAAGWRAQGVEGDRGANNKTSAALPRNARIALMETGTCGSSDEHSARSACDVRVAPAAPECAKCKSRVNVWRPRGLLRCRRCTTSDTRAQGDDRPLLAAFQHAICPPARLNPPCDFCEGESCAFSTKSQAGARQSTPGGLDSRCWLQVPMSARTGDARAQPPHHPFSPPFVLFEPKISSRSQRKHDVCAPVVTLNLASVQTITLGDSV